MGFGMALQGVRSCGDYMFSGHTCVVTMLNFFVTECKIVHNIFLNSLRIIYVAQIRYF